MKSLSCRIIDYLIANIDSYTLVDNKLQLFHCGNAEVILPNIVYSKCEGERGVGFYTAYALKGCIIGKYGNKGVISVYDFDLSELERIVNRYVCKKKDNYLDIIHIDDIMYGDIGYRNILLLDSGKSKFTKKIGGQVVFYSQYIIDTCLAFSYSIDQNTMYKVYSSLNGEEGLYE